MNDKMIAFINVAILRIKNGEKGSMIWHPDYTISIMPNETTPVPEATPYCIHYDEFGNYPEDLKI